MIPQKTRRKQSRAYQMARIPAHYFSGDGSGELMEGWEDLPETVRAPLVTLVAYGAGMVTSVPRIHPG